MNVEQTGQTNLPIFKTLETAISDFVNKNVWTDKEVEPYQQIDCSMFITVLGYQANTFTANIQVQSNRPVYGSVMSTPVLNYNDQQFTFVYNEFQPLNYDPNTFVNNLISVLSFYVYTILGLDADTYSELGGDEYFEEALQIVNTAQQSGSAGWSAGAGSNANRFRLNKDLLSNNFIDFRKALYTYHRLGLDVMHEDVKAGKEAIINSIATLRAVNNNRPNSLLMRSFFDAKATEIEAIFTGGPSVPIADLKDNLSRISPMNNKNWRNIKM
ncbi:DUF4835 family protein [Gangjinia marincola]|uniref:DUF4835 family protein n=2 Tax=Gangjinia marincola TaxID=578463 RepID=A0ABP3XQR0_9FLAO